MKYSICSISFRHQLISFTNLANVARELEYDGIELWGIHAENLYESERGATAEQLRSLHQEGIEITMLSDYLDISSGEAFPQTLKKCDRLLTLADWLEVRRIRTFAGERASASLPMSQRMEYTERLRKLCERCKAAGVDLLVETHPHTLADSLQSTLTLLTETGANNLKLNFDALHVWEFGEDLLHALHVLEPWIGHLHLKNVSSADRLSIFEPSSIYSSAGSRQGMVPLQGGAVDYLSFIKHADHLNCYASIEWFGPHPIRALREEIAWLRSQHCRLA